MFYLSEETLINELLENIDMIDDFDEGDGDSGSGSSIARDLRETGSSSSDDSSTNEESLELSSSAHVVYVQKRPYRQRKRKITPPKPSKRYQPIIIPRILKGDIRRRYAQMYANVMNSYNYDLVMSYFQRFYVPSASMTKNPVRDNPNPVTEIHGIELLTYYYLILQQSAPDKITKVCDIQLKQRSDSDDIEIICHFSASYTQLYELTPNSIPNCFKEQTQLTLQDKPVLGKRKMNDEVEYLLPSLDRSMFDPINGVFCQSRFQRLPAPKPHCVDGQMIMKINSMKQIVSIAFGPLPNHPSNVPLCQSISDERGLPPTLPLPISTH